MIITLDKKEIGCLCYANFHLQPHRAELDIWLNAQKYCGHGYGTDALEKMMEYLKSNMNINKFLIRPSKKNLPAIKSYKKAGFLKVNAKKAVISEYLLPKYLEEYSEGDYGFENTTVLILE
jgi:diamine N-acetyltransferase